MPSFSLLYLRLRVQKHTSYSIFYRVFIARTSIYETSFIIILLINNNYSNAMRRLCLSGFRLVALFGCLVAPPFAVRDAHNQDERQQVATFIANLALFQQRVSAMLET